MRNCYQHGGDKDQQCHKNGEEKSADNVSKNCPANAFYAELAKKLNQCKHLLDGWYKWYNNTDV